MDNADENEQLVIEPTDNAIRKRETRTAVVRFCRAYGGDMQVGPELEFDSRERSERGQDFWFGFELMDSRGASRGEISVGYVRINCELRIYAALVVDEEEVCVRSMTLDELAARHSNGATTQPRELKALLIEVAELATRKILGKRGGDIGAWWP